MTDRRFENGEKVSFTDSKTGKLLYGKFLGYTEDATPSGSPMADISWKDEDGNLQTALVDSKLLTEC